MRKSRANDPILKEQNRIYYLSHKSELSGKAIKRYYADPEKHKERSREYHKSNRDKINKTMRKYYQKNIVKMKEYSRNDRARYPEKYEDRFKKWKYGLSLKDYLVMAEQQKGKCMICDEVIMGNGATGKLHIDHDHEKGNVRGLLCYKCNVGLGYFKDNPKILLRAIDYLNEIQ